MDSDLEKALKSEIERNEELLVEYKSIPQGVFGATLIEYSLKKARSALISCDIVELVKALQDLREIK